MVFVPAQDEATVAALEDCLRAQGCRLLGWRDVPVNVGVLGEIALSTMPAVRQVLVASADEHRGV